MKKRQLSLDIKKQTNKQTNKNPKTASSGTGNAKCS